MTYGFERDERCRGRYRGFGALRRSRPWSERDQLDQEARAAEATAIRERDEAEWEAVSRAAGVTPGSVAELRLNHKQAYFAWWRERNLDLIEQVRCGRTQCCGEWQREGYYGWCSLLGRPVNFLETTNEQGELQRESCDQCPRARANQEMSAWFSLWLYEIEAICKGEIDV